MEKVSRFAVEATVTQTDGVTGLIGLNVQGATAVLLLYPGQPPVAVPEVVPVYKCQVIEIQLKNRKKTMRNPVQDGTIMI